MVVIENKNYAAQIEASHMAFADAYHLYPTAPIDMNACPIKRPQEAREKWRSHQWGQALKPFWEEFHKRLKHHKNAIA